ncbi:MAG: hypothetical protein U0359_16540 [Byssovorax sp.]
MALTQEEEDYVRNVGRWFYGHAPAQVNEQLAAVVAEMVQKVLEGTNAMHLVPRPTGGMPGALWLVSQGVQAWWRVHHEDRVYLAVKQSVALGYKSTYAMAEMGL